MHGERPQRVGPLPRLRLRGGGLARGVTKAGAGGQPLTRHFCRGCGSPVYTSSPRHPDAVFVKGCAFDDPGSVLPATEAWTCSEVPWARIPAGLSRHRRDKAP